MRNESTLVFFSFSFFEFWKLVYLPKVPILGFAFRFSVDDAEMGASLKRSALMRRIDDLILVADRTHNNRAGNLAKRGLLLEHLA